MNDGGIACIPSHRPHHRPCPLPLGHSRLRGVFHIPDRQVVDRTRLVRSSPKRGNCLRLCGVNAALRQSVSNVVVDWRSGRWCSTDFIRMPMTVMFARVEDWADTQTPNVVTG
jgi:hypothetical protein